MALFFFMDILQKIALTFENDLLALVIKRVGIFRRSLIVELSDGSFGLSTYDGQGKKLKVERERVKSFLEQRKFENTFFRAIFLAICNAYYNREQRLINVHYQKAHHFLYEQKEIKSIASIGRFPFIKKIADKNRNISIFELNPEEGEFCRNDYHLLNNYQTVFITAMTLMNGTFDEVFSFCSESGHTILIGPTTPFHPVLLTSGIHTIAGAVIDDGATLWESLAKGASFKQAKGMRFWSYDV